MVYLKSYECHSCHNLCKGYVNKGFYETVGICVDCGYLICGKCTVSVEERKPKCEVTGKQCCFISYYTAYVNYLTQYAPDDELRLLNFGKWSPLWSICCKKSITPNNKLAYRDAKSYCVKCKPADIMPKQPPVDTYRKIINEFKGYFSEEEDNIVVRKGIKLESLKCTICKKNSRPICLSETAVLHCKDCKDKFEHSYEVRRPGICRIFNVLLLYIPDVNDLKLLTYSKWTPLRCEQCSILLSEEYNQLPMFHPECRQIICRKCSCKHKCGDGEAKFPIVMLQFLVDAIIEFRALFKNGGVEDVPLVISRNSVNVEKNPLETNYICTNKESDDEKKLAQSQNGRSGSFISRKISCQCCSRPTEISEARNCLKCEIHGVCTVCLTNDHWGHEIMKTEEGMMQVLLQDDAAVTLEKLRKWNGYMNDTHVQGVAVRKELCESYKCAYEKAIKYKDPRLFQGIRQENIKKIQKSAEDFLSSHIRFNEDVQALAERLRSLGKDD